MSSQVSTVGIDISKAELEVSAYPADTSLTVDYDEAGCERLSAQLKQSLSASLRSIETAASIEENEPPGAAAPLSEPFSIWQR